MSRKKTRQRVLEAAGDTGRKEVRSPAAGPPRQLSDVEAAKQLGISPTILRSRTWRGKHGFLWFRGDELIFHGYEPLDRWRFDFKNDLRKPGRR